MLVDLGLKVLTASNGKDALAIEEKYDGAIHYLLTDVVMPELNGVKLSSMFRNIRPMTKIIFMSGYPINGGSSRVSLSEEEILLPKPIRMEALRNVFIALAEGGQKEGGRTGDKPGDQRGQT